MIQINITLIIQIMNFLVFMLLLNALLYKPVVAKIREREARIRKDREKAAELDQQVQEQEKRHQETASDCKAARRRGKKCLNG